MDLLLILTYTGFCVVIFKVFRIQLNKWTVPTAILGGIVLLGTILMLMNYNHPYGKYAKESFISVPIVPAVKGIVISVEAEPNTPLKNGDVLFRIDPKPYEMKVSRKHAQLAEAEQQVKRHNWKRQKHVSKRLPQIVIEASSHSIVMLKEIREVALKYFRNKKWRTAANSI
ncbi:MAG: hypothetical protein AAES65_04120 [Candidatus Thiodiazotropha sp. (ex. Lucinoma kazani)]